MAQSVETLFPELSVFIDPSTGLAHGFRFKVDAMDPAVLFPPHEFGALKDFDVFGNRWPRDAEGFREIAHCRVAPGETLENRATGGVGQGRESIVQDCVCIFYHLVKL